MKQKVKPNKHFGSMLQTCQHNTFADFFDLISPLNTRGIMADGNIFRGESTSSYSLLPSILRDSSTSFRGKFPFLEKNIHTKDFILHEHYLLEQFCILANTSGLPVPNNFSDVLRASKPEFSSTPFPWLNPDLENLAALAQHYGIPTRCLDWSQDIFTAIYFASMGACRRIQENIETGKTLFEDNDFFVIWVLNTQKLDKWPYPIRFIVPPYSQNPNLRAQRGVLTYWPEQIVQSDEGKPVERIPLNELFESYWKTNGRSVYPPNTFPLQKHLLPITECISAFSAVRKLGYTASKLFPGYSGASRELEEEHIIQYIIRECRQKGITML
jgi:hypothetical protein